MAVFNRVLSTVLAIALVALGLLLAVEAVLALLDLGPWLLFDSPPARFVTDHPWASAPMRLTLVGLGLVGLVLLAAELRRRQPAVLDLGSTARNVRLSATRGSLKRLIETTAEAEEGVDGATAVVTRRGANVTVRTHLREAAGLQDRVRQAIDGRLEAVQLAKPLPTNVRIEQDER